MANLIDVHRPIAVSIDQNGERGEPAQANYLLAKLDENEDGRVITYHRLPFADHAGLEAEWNAQAATTVLQSAVVGELPDVNFTVDQLSAAQRGVTDLQLMES